MKKLFLILFLAAFVACDNNTPTNPPIDNPLPMSGVAVPQLAAFDDAMQQYTAARGKKAGTLAIMKDGVVVFERGYGWKDRELKTLLRPDALFRLASVTKPITAAAIRKLIREGRLNATDKVFCLPGSGTPCWFNLEPFGTPDPRLKDITIQQLLDHKAGWERSNYDGVPHYWSHRIANALGIPSPPSEQDYVRFMMGQPLNYAPGTTYSYSSFGYMLLGLIIEQVTGQTYLHYVQENIFNPLGIPDTEIGLARSLPEFHHPREPWYSSSFVGTSVFPPYMTVPLPDGGSHMEAVKGAGGLIASSRALLKFLQAYWADGTPRSGNGRTYIFFGGIDGTFTMAYWKSDGVNIVALFNKRKEGDLAPNDFEIMSILDRVADSITNWPTTEPK